MGAVVCYLIQSAEPDAHTHTAATAAFAGLLPSTTAATGRSPTAAATGETERETAAPAHRTTIPSADAAPCSLLRSRSREVGWGGPQQQRRRRALSPLHHRRHRGRAVTRRHRGTAAAAAASSPPSSGPAHLLTELGNTPLLPCIRLALQN